MNKDELITVLKEQFGELAKVLKGADPKPEPDAKSVIKFEGDPSNPKDVKAHLDRVRLSQIDFTDPKSVEQHLASLTKKSEPAEEKVEEKVEKSAEEKAEIAKLRKELAKLEGKTDQPDPKKSEPADVVSHLSKSEQEAWARGEAMAKFVNAE